MSEKQVKPPDGPELTLSPVAAMRAQLTAARAALLELESQLQRLEQDGNQRSERRRPDRYYAVLLDVYERGIHGVDRETFWAIGAAHGYDRRGLGGFFAGGRAPLQMRSRIGLTAEGRVLISKALQHLPEPA